MISLCHNYYCFPSQFQFSINKEDRQASNRVCESWYAHFSYDVKESCLTVSLIKFMDALTTQIHHKSMRLRHTHIENLNAIMVGIPFIFNCSFLRPRAFVWLVGAILFDRLGTNRHQHQRGVNICDWNIFLSGVKLQKVQLFRF